MKTITESEMNFGRYKEENLFEIENSQIRKSLGEGVKTVEFILLKNDTHIIFLEAKKNCPNEHNMNDSPNKRLKFENFYNDVTQKFTDSLQVYLAAILNRYGNLSEIGHNLCTPENYSEKEIFFVLVIKCAEISWLSGVKAILEKRLLSLRKIWKIKILVLNHELAQKKGLALKNDASDF